MKHPNRLFTASFYLNLLISLLWIILITPVFDHASSESWILGYSKSYVIYLVIVTFPAILFIVSAFLLDDNNRKRCALISLFSFALLEFVSRIALPPKGYAEMDAYRDPKPYIMFSGKPNSTSHVAWMAELDPQIQKDEAIYTLNALGFRGIAPASPKPADEFRVVMLGGSTVFNGLPLSQSLSGHLETLLRESGIKNAKVYNWGIVSAVSGQELSLLVHQVTTYAPDLVIVYDGYNDLLSPFNGDPRPGYPYNFMIYEEGLLRVENRAPLTNLLRSIFYKSHLLKMVFVQRSLDAVTPRASLRASADYGSKEWKAKIVSTYTENIKKMATVAKAFNFTFAHFYQPNLFAKDKLSDKEKPLISEGELKDYVLQQNQATREAVLKLKNEFASEPGLIFDDLNELFKDNPEMMYWDQIHTFNSGNKLIAQKIHEILIQKKALRTTN